MSETMLTNRPEDEVSRLAKAASEALTDSMVERLTVTGANAMEVVDRLNDEDTRDAVLNVIDRLTELNRVGAVDTLFDTVMLLHAAKQASTDSIVERLFAFMEHMVNNFGHEDIASMVDNARLSMDDAAAEAARTKPSGGLFATLGMLSKPETQRTLQFLLSFGSNMQQRACEERRSD